MSAQVLSLAMLLATILAFVVLLVFITRDVWRTWQKFDPTRPSAADLDAYATEERIREETAAAQRRGLREQ